MIRLSVLVLTTSLMTGLSYASDLKLPVESDSDFATTMANLVILADRDVASERYLPYSIRILKTRADGECDGSPESCPTENGFVVLSAVGEFPERRFYRLPDAYGWEFNSWIEQPLNESLEQYFVVRLTRRVIAEDTSAGWWSERQYDLWVNMSEALLKDVP